MAKYMQISLKYTQVLLLATRNQSLLHHELHMLKAPNHWSSGKDGAHTHPKVDIYYISYIFLPETVLYLSSGLEEDTSNISLFIMEYGQDTNEKQQKKSCVANLAKVGDSSGSPCWWANMALARSWPGGIKLEVY